MAINEELSTDCGILKLSKKSYYIEPIGESLYNTYTDVLYVFPDAVCTNFIKYDYGKMILNSLSGGKPT